MLLEPVLGLGRAALRAVPVVAGMVGVVEGAAGGAGIDGAPHGWSATGQDLAQDLALADGHGRSVALQVGRPPTEQHLVERQGLGHARRGGRVHGRT